MDEISIEKKFSDALKVYVDTQAKEEKKGYISRLAKRLGVTQGFLSNVIAGRRHGDEAWRRSVAKTIGVDYDEMIGIRHTTDISDTITLTDAVEMKLIRGEPAPPTTERRSTATDRRGNIRTFPIRGKPLVDERLEIMKEKLEKIYRSGDKALVAAIESNLYSFAETVESKLLNKTLRERVELIEEKLNMETQEKLSLKAENESLRSRLLK